MCGRYSIIKVEEIPERFSIEQMSIEFEPSYNVAPTQNVPVIIRTDKNYLKMFKWGLIPSGAKDSSIAHKMINARAETVDVKPSFKYSFKRKRCLILADGFYEWKREGNKKIPYRITLKDEKVFAFAGLWDSWLATSGHTINSCTIITTIPNEIIKPIHNRMPVILPKNQEEQWLDTSISDVESIKSLLKPLPAELMNVYEISSLINSPRNNNPELIAKVVNKK